MIIYCVGRIKQNSRYNLSDT